MTKLSNLLTSGLRIIDTQTYSSNATWTKPAGAVYVRVVLCGGGASGNGGATASTEGGGGAGGAINVWEGPASALSSTESVVVGAGGTAVAANTVGIAGGQSEFGSVCRAPGAPAAGTVDVATAPNLGGLWSMSSAPVTAATRESTNGPGSSGAGTQLGKAGAVYLVAGGGGGGGGSGGGESVGRAGGARVAASTTSGGGGAGGTAAVGSAGANGSLAGGQGGAGGGGGGYNSSGNGYAGGAGGVPGGGGGGGGTGSSGTGGAGGAGGAGGVYVETWG